MHYISIIFLLSFILLASSLYGDITIPLNSSSYTDSLIQLHFYLDPTNITIVAKFNSYAYFALLYSSRMSTGDYSVVQIISSAITLKDYYTTT